MSRVGDEKKSWHKNKRWEHLTSTSETATGASPAAHAALSTAWSDEESCIITWGALIMLFEESAEVMEVMEEKSAETGVEWEPKNIKRFEAQCYA